MIGSWDATAKMADAGAAAGKPAGARPSRKSRLALVAGMFLVLFVQSAGSKDGAGSQAISRVVAHSQIAGVESPCVRTHSQVLPEASLVGMLPQSLQSAAQRHTEKACSKLGETGR